MPDRVAAANAAIDSERLRRRPDGSPVRQVSSPDIVARMLRLLAVRTGDRVLEVGTGSGHSTALLAHLVGPSGSVVSLDVDRDLVERAAPFRGGGLAEEAAIDGAFVPLTAEPFRPWEAEL
ncbi:MAG: protein-L-isoaspartate O-methyltransferase [Actinomycetota bacterium]|nr:protein-L-isoaspartate O-methyltransferase [Actinomycetota bacterium]